MNKFPRLPLVLVAVLGLSLPLASAASAQPTAPERGIKISGVGLTGKKSFGVKIRWDQRDLQKKNALSVSLVAVTDGVGNPVFRQLVTAKAKQPKRHYTFSLNRKQKRLVRNSDGLGVAVSQRTGIRNGLYQRAWVARSGKFPSARLTSSSLASRCSPAQAGGSYTGCYYGYTDMSSMDLHGATFADAQFPFTTVAGSNFTSANLSATQFGYATMSNGNFTSADLTASYLYGANMRNAILTNATLTNAQYCNTVLPDGTTNNANC